MEGQSSSGQPQHIYQSNQWSRLVRRNTHTASTLLTSPNPLESPPISPPIEILPNLLSQTTSTYQAQLENYNKLVKSSGRSTRGLSSPLPPVLTPQHIQAVPRQGPRKNSQAGHGNKNAQNSSNGGRPLIVAEAKSANMSSTRFDQSSQRPSRPFAPHQNSSLSHQSSSVPTTPHQHARKFSSGSREPSPTAVPNLSPRSAYSENNSTAPSSHPVQRQGACRFEAPFNTRRRMGYNIGDEKLERIDPSNVKSKQTKEEEAKLTGDMRELYNRLLPTERSDLKRQKFVQKLERLLNGEWPGHDIRVHMFGSSGNLLCTDESDVDICITTEWKELESVCKLAELLSRHGMQKVVCRPTAKVPIVKIWDPELKLACDMNVNNTLALENTRMILTYVQIDERVRPLAMIIKYWTNRRIINDAAYGNTLSSYTWICMIINFLQTRNPPVLPALHQRPHQKLPPKDGHESVFADDLDTLRGFGSKNKETLGELLFHFFRFYGHELDYDDDISVVSVRNGKLISKKGKKWHLAINNRLCVEEPFNVVRNLANTADDTSFRGLHLELRRAFDLISEANLDECCEEYIFPKQEEKIWEKAPPQPVPIISRSTSQSRGGKNGGGNRHRPSNVQNRNGNGGRRASSGTSGFFDRNPGYLAPGVPGWTPSESWLQTQEAQRQLQNDFYNTMSVLQAQENNLRMQLYTQSQAFAQAQAQAFSHAQRMQGSGAFTTQPVTDRSRGSSFDNVPLTAPIRQDTFFYPLQYQVAPMYVQQAPSTYPSSPSMSPALPESRRSLHRSTAATGSKTGNGIANSSGRSQSQPASRTLLSPTPVQGVPNAMPGFIGYQPTRQIPKFIVDDEYLDNGFETEYAGTLPESVQDDAIPKRYVGWRMDDADGVNGVPPPTPPRKSMVPPAIPAFGDLGQRRRRMSTDQFPQAIIDRLNRQSRSPSPGRDQTHTSSTPLPSGPFQRGPASISLRTFEERAPPIVSESLLAASSQIPSPPIAQSAASNFNDQAYFHPSDSAGWIQETPLTNGEPFGQYTPVGLGVTVYPQGKARPDLEMSATGGTALTVLSPPIVNSSLEPRGMKPLPRKSHAPVLESSDKNRLSPERAGHQMQNGAVSPLDIGASHSDVVRDEIPHLSPVYEARTPSPTASRKLEHGAGIGRNVTINHMSNRDPEMALKVAPVNNFQKLPSSLSPKANGHTRASKSEGSGSATGGWQKITKSKKKAQSSEQKAMDASQNQEMPKLGSERKGG